MFQVIVLKGEVEKLKAENERLRTAMSSSSQNMKQWEQETQVSLEVHPIRARPLMQLEC